MIETRAQEPSRKYMRMTKVSDMERRKIREIEHKSRTSSLPLIGILKREQSGKGTNH